MPESPEHLYQKERIRNLARREGYIAENEIAFWCWSEYHAKPILYSVDVFIHGNGAPTVVEVDGYRGHGNRYQSGRDERRTQDIRNTWGDNIRVHRLTIAELKIASDEEIKEDLGI